MIYLQIRELYPERYWTNLISSYLVSIFLQGRTILRVFNEWSIRKQNKARSVHFTVMRTNQSKGNENRFLKKLNAYHLSEKCIKLDTDWLEIPTNPCLYYKKKSMRINGTMIWERSGEKCWIEKLKNLYTFLIELMPDCAVQIVYLSFFLYME